MMVGVESERSMTAIDWLSHWYDDVLVESDFVIDTPNNFDYSVEKLHG